MHDVIFPMIVPDFKHDELLIISCNAKYLYFQLRIILVILSHVIEKLT